MTNFIKYITNPTELIMYKNPSTTYLFDYGNLPMIVFKAHVLQSLAHTIKKSKQPIKRDQQQFTYSKEKRLVIQVPSITELYYEARFHLTEYEIMRLIVKHNEIINLNEGETTKTHSIRPILKIKYTKPTKTNRDTQQEYIILIKSKKGFMTKKKLALGDYFSCTIKLKTYKTLWQKLYEVGILKQNPEDIIKEKKII